MQNKFIEECTELLNNHHTLTRDGARMAVRLLEACKRLEAAENAIINLVSVATENVVGMRTRDQGFETLKEIGRGFNGNPQPGSSIDIVTFR